MYLPSGSSRRQDEPDLDDGPDDSTSTAVPTPTSTDASSTSTTPSATSASSTPSTQSHPSGGGSSTYVVAIVISVVAVIALIVGILLVRRTRMKHKNPRYLPTNFLKSAWQKWEPKSPHDRLPNSDDNERTSDDNRARSTDTSRPQSTVDASNTPGNRNSTASADVNRNTSVRSVMTLPAYNPHALQNEQVIGREGERGGIDVVVEFPETVEEEEALREDEMEALYQVRLARRRENEEREEGRRLRREARERGDFVALREIQNRPRGEFAASNERTVEDLRAEHERIKKARARAISSVSYADLGIARHDGTKIRGNSDESERQGLLGDAASFGAGSHYHRRERSNSSILSFDTNNSDGLPSPGLTRSRGNSQPQTSLRNVTDQNDTEGQAGSSPEMIEHDDVPLNSPPGYENISLQDTEEDHTEPPPDYTIPILDRGEARPGIEGRRASHIGHLFDKRRASASGSIIARNRHSAGPLSAPPLDRPRSGNFTSTGVPRLRSLRLGGLPSIHVDPSSPVVGKERQRTINEEDHHLEE